MDGFLNLNKPSGFTSHDAVAKVRRLLKLKRVGHAGTLDPAATGVLPVALGRATRLLQFLRQDKAYRATIRFGMKTTTDDLEGETLLAQPVPELELEMIKALLPEFQGTLQQVPPDYSAIQVQGKRLYELARKGERIVAQPRSVEVFSLEVLDWRPGDFPEVDLAIACGSGTYIRAIARDLGNALKTGGTLAALLRTASSGFKLADSLTLEELEVQVQAGTFQPVLPELALEHLPAIALPASTARRWCQGQKVGVRESDLADGWAERAGQPIVLTASSILRIHDENSQFLGITQVTRGETDFVLSPKVVFADAEGLVI
ncbi:MAG: tRNA pseudouridine(55) synthase TruB [Leptolyngbyaceae cyanobacterium HOT.MB2.61]|jgi:tRNA pseudouridine55 synthase|nr:tRNA pseudouridine(55) synthase TruB [Leptolyngbyaceae cyanobacterium HOT.MB2.61]